MIIKQTTNLVHFRVETKSESRPPTENFLNSFPHFLMGAKAPEVEKCASNKKIGKYYNFIP